ncbi:MAG: isoleucine--tRNA ligase, partial [Candidatus Nanoarchaeia archaeon]|nr:isoleucine--tRNA ligase [Candidatus Jingweiarchaeum tengchongense]
YEFWEKEKIFDRLIKRRKDGKKFFFLEGPPTLNGFPHVGHFRGRAIKDIVLRYKSMQGFNIRRQAGWDCQGLPVELEVEKELNIKTKKDIEKFGADKFIQKCKESVLKYKEIWERNSKRLGMWMDWKAYMTMDDDYIEFVWFTIKNAYEKKLLKKDFRVVAWCPRCETSLAQHEVGQGYELRKDPSIFIKFKLLNNKDEYLLVWTTTPWTLISNVAIAAHPDATYVKVKVDNEVLILLKNLVEKVIKEKDYKIIDEFPGKKLDGLKYEPIIEIEFQNFEHRVVLSETVSIEEGTGLVHIAPGHGPEDFEIGKKYKLKFLSPVNESGIFEGVDEFNGLSVKEASEKVIERLKEEGKLFKHSIIEHEYPCCWRCGTPLVYRLAHQWFISVDNLKKKMLEENAKVIWIPEWTKNRFDEWLKNAQDWCISRKRYWGTPLPIWECKKCKEILVLGSKDELKRAMKKPRKIELHRPWVDEVVFKCKKCNSEMVRVEEVADCWLDSGCAPGASLGYITNEDEFKYWYPADFITEGTDQTRGWYYTLLFSNVLVFGSSPYKLVLNQGLALDEEGKKMSKSKGNVIWAEDTLNKIGADIFRFYVIWKSDIWDSINFSLKETSLIFRLLNAFWNMHLLLKEQMELDDLNFRDLVLDNKILKIEDKWLVSRLNSRIKNTTNFFEGYRLTNASREIHDFLLEDVSRFYIQVVRDRMSSENLKDKINIYCLLRECLIKAAQIIAPICPYISDAIYRNLGGKEISVHLEEWPSFDETKINVELERKMQIVRDFVQALQACRDRVNISLRWPLRKAFIITKEDLHDFDNVIKKLANVKEVVFLEGEPSFVEKVHKVNYEIIEKKFKQDLPEVIRKIMEMSTKSIEKALEKEKKFVISLEDGKKIEILEEDIKVEKKFPKNIVGNESNVGFVYLD